MVSERLAASERIYSPRGRQDFQFFASGQNDLPTGGTYLREVGERRAVGSGSRAFLNRLSDALFVLARWMGKQQSEPEYLWRRDANAD